MKQVKLLIELNLIEVKKLNEKNEKNEKIIKEGENKLNELKEILWHVEEIKNSSSNASTHSHDE